MNTLEYAVPRAPSPTKNGGWSDTARMIEIGRSPYGKMRVVEQLLSKYEKKMLFANEPVLVGERDADLQSW